MSEKNPSVPEPVVPTVVPPAKSFPVPPDKNPGGTLPDSYKPGGAKIPTKYL